MNKTFHLKLLYFFVTIFLVSASLIITPHHTLAKADTGGYPWFDASTISAATYDWGYTSCQPAMQLAHTCHSHKKTKLGITYFLSDPWRYDVRNCTSFAAWKIHQEFGISIPGWGNANSWDTNAVKSGYTVNQTPTVGSIAQWEGGFGHVAFVTAINPDGSVNVEQYNKAGTGHFSRQSRVRAANYIHIQTTKLPQQSVPLQINENATNSDSPIKAEQLSSSVLPPLTPESIFNTNNNGITYVPAVDPETNQTTFYAFQKQNTASGKVEVSKSNVLDGNSTWVHSWNLDIPAAQKADNDFLVADYDADGHLDVYKLENNSENSKLNITVFNGKNDFQNTLGSWDTESLSSVENSKYSIADYDGDGSLDLFNIQKNTTNTKIQVTILSASNNFKHSLTSLDIPDVEDSVLPAMFELDDHNRDGKPDIYKIQFSDQNRTLQHVSVYDASSDYKNLVWSWKNNAQ